MRGMVESLRAFDGTADLDPVCDLSRHRAALQFGLLAHEPHDVIGQFDGLSHFSLQGIKVAHCHLEFDVQKLLFG